MPLGGGTLAEDSQELRGNAANQAIEVPALIQRNWASSSLHQADTPMAEARRTR
jgi:hypothetical protein